MYPCLFRQVHKGQSLEDNLEGLRLYDNQLSGEIYKEIGHRRAQHFGATFVES